MVKRPLSMRKGRSIGLEVAIRRERDGDRVKNSDWNICKAFIELVAILKNDGINFKIQYLTHHYVSKLKVLNSSLKRNGVMDEKPSFVIPSPGSFHFKAYKPKQSEPNDGDLITINLITK